MAPLLWQLRVIKSLAAEFERAAVGVTEREVARAVGEATMREGADRPGFVMMASGADNHHVSTEEKRQWIADRLPRLRGSHGASHRSGLVERDGLAHAFRPGSMRSPFGDRV